MRAVRQTTSFKHQFLGLMLTTAVLIFVFPVNTNIFCQTRTADSTTAANLTDTPLSTEKLKVNAPSKAALALPAESLIHFGDTIDVDVLGSLEYDWRGKTDDEGFLNDLPSVVDPIFALCRTEAELAAEIAEAYKQFIREPQVVVRVTDRSERQPALLLGAVRTPQRFRIQRPVRLSELVVLSGGITDRASGEVRIFRPSHFSCADHNKKQPDPQYLSVKLMDLLAGKPDANPFIRTGDVVTVEDAAPVYVTGGVVAPQRILFRPGLTLSRAVASAGGLSENGEASKIMIFRRQPVGTELQIIESDLEKINRKQSEDVALQAYDIVEVTTRGRQRDRRPPIVNNLDTAQINLNNLPQRVIN